MGEDGGNGHPLSQNSFWVVAAAPPAARTARASKNKILGMFSQTGVGHRGRISLSRRRKMPGPPAFKDLGKKSSGLVNDDYKYETKAELKRPFRGVVGPFQHP